MAHPLREYIGASGDSLSAFAERVGLSRRTLSRIISDERAPQPDIARRIVEATGGSVPFAALYASGADVVDLSANRRDDDGLNVELLGPILRQVLAAVKAVDAHIGAKNHARSEPRGARGRARRVCGANPEI